MKGHVVLEITSVRDGRVVRRLENNNLFLTGGYHELRRVLKGDSTGGAGTITSLALGRGTSSPLAADTSLEVPVLTKDVDNVSYDDPNGKVIITTYLQSNEGNGFAFTEAGLLSAAGVLMARTTFAVPEIKTSEYRFTYTWTITAG